MVRSVGNDGGDAFAAIETWQEGWPQAPDDGQ